MGLHVCGELVDRALWIELVDRALWIELVDRVYG
jgi:predicted outer membrane lipoprotein